HRRYLYNTLAVMSDSFLSLTEESSMSEINALMDKFEAQIASRVKQINEIRKQMDELRHENAMDNIDIKGLKQLRSYKYASRQDQNDIFVRVHRYKLRTKRLEFRNQPIKGECQNIKKDTGRRCRNNERTRGLCKKCFYASIETYKI